MNSAIHHLQARGVSPIKLTVTKWNKNAIALYESLGFVITKESTVSGVNALNDDGDWAFDFVETEGLDVQ